MARITIHVQPRASANRIAGRHGDVWHVRVTAAPVEGAANDAVVALLAKCLGVHRSAIRIERGLTGRTKVVSVDGLTEEVALERLGAHVSGDARRG